MNLFQKLRFYLNLKRKNYRNAFYTAFTNNKLTDFDWYFIILTICLILGAITLKYADEIDATIALSEKRAYDAKNTMQEALKQLHEREYLLAHMLNKGYIRIDGVTRKVCVADYNNDCL